MESKINMFDDFLKVQKEMESLKKNETNPFFKSKYVTLEQVLGVIKPVLHENNFVVVQAPFVAEGISYLRTKLMHKGGEEIVGEMKLVTKDSNDPQKIGCSLTYMRRYSLCSMLGMEEKDDDGNDASKEILITDQQKKEFSELYINIIEACKFAGVQSINELTKESAQKIINLKKTQSKNNTNKQEK